VSPAKEAGVSRAFPMTFAADYMVLFDRLDEELRVAPQLDRSLFTKSSSVPAGAYLF